MLQTVTLFYIHCEFTCTTVIIIFKMGAIIIATNQISFAFAAFIAIPLSFITGIGFSTTKIVARTGREF
jgi:hypothetical protein